ncbi:MAG: hypothetical protein QF607_06650 [Nitrospinaceae bacterium]|nr:hypothetical protein [Nitrospinaceae bacterium]
MSRCERKEAMADKGSDACKILFYISLFLMSVLVFESTSVILAVAVALLALYYFTSKSSRRDQF